MDLAEIKEAFRVEGRSVSNTPLFFDDAVDWLISEVERLTAERYSILSAKEVHIVPPAMPESELISHLQKLLNEAHTERVRSQHAAYERIENAESRYERMSEKADSALRRVDECQRTICELTRAQGQQWRLISGAMPEPDEWVLLWNGHWCGVGKFDSSWDDECNQWQDETTEFITPAPTHWMPLPTRPEAI